MNQGHTYRAGIWMPPSLGTRAGKGAVLPQPDTTSTTNSNPDPTTVPSTGQPPPRAKGDSEAVFLTDPSGNSHPTSTEIAGPFLTLSVTTKAPPISNSAGWFGLR
ncbi:hypothetical protein GCM10009845_16190 [Pedococcus bigeumensis]